LKNNRRVSDESSAGRGYGTSCNSGAVERIAFGHGHATKLQFLGGVEFSRGGGAEGLRQQGDTRKEFVLAAFYSFTVAPLQPETAKIEKGVNVNPARRTTDHGVV